MNTIFSDRTYTATLNGWSPKCNQELEVRVRLNFAVPLTDELVDELPEGLRKLALAIGRLEDGLTEGSFSTDYEQSLALYEVPDAGQPILKLENVLLTGMHIYRPTPKDGPSEDLFLCFSTTVRAEGAYGVDLVSWALPHLRRTVFFRPYELQGRLPLEGNAA